MPAREYEVAIVGGGPVGVALAVDLGQRGVRTLLVERHLEPQRIPKGQNLTNRSLEHFYFRHCIDELRAARVMPPGYPSGGVTVYQDLTNPYFYTMQWGGRGPAVQDYFYERAERLPQYRTEAVLRQRLAALPSVAPRFGWNATDVKQDANGVSVSLSPVAGGALESATAEYVVGCDGGRSLVRECMGVDHDGRDFDQRMVLAVFRSRELHEFLSRFPPATTYRVLKPELQGYWQFFGRVDVGEEFFFHAPVPGTPSLRTTIFSACSALRPASSSMRSWTTSASGTCASWLPAATAWDACLSRATRAISIRRTGASA
ncbi:MAG TPA: FAD-dependent monooxygenase [Chloroflexota bacterium]